MPLNPRRPRRPQVTRLNDVARSNNPATRALAQSIRQNLGNNVEWRSEGPDNNQLSEDEMTLVYVNRESGKKYQVVANDGTRVTVRRLGDGAQFVLTMVKFQAKYEQTAEQLSDADECPYTIIEPDPERFTFDKMVLYPDCVAAIETGLSRITNYDAMEEVWQISKLEPGRRTILNFYSLPGTGKTLAAKCIATKLGKKFVLADYSQLISKWHGESGKHIKAFFDYAAEHDYGIFLDEADALVSKRIGMSSDRMTIASGINQERIVFMSCLDAFNGVVILATNFFKNFDEAVLRRCADNIAFRLPNQEMRKKLFINHVPNMERVREDVNWSRVAKLTKGCSGGDIFQIMVNAIAQVSLHPDRSQWYLSQEALESAASRVMDAKESHQSGRGSLGPKAPKKAAEPEKEVIKD